MILLSFSLCFLGLMLIALNMSKHYEQIIGNKGQLPSLAKWLGFLILLGSIYPCYLHSGISIGISLWLTLLTMATVILMFLLTYKTRLILPSSIAILVLSSILLAAQSAGVI